MPRRDGTGPIGAGAGTGRGAGPCVGGGAGLGFGGGSGRGAGFGGGRRRLRIGPSFAPVVTGTGTRGTAPAVPEDAEALQTRIDALKAEIECLEQGIRAMGSAGKRS
jgi:hypothetical protein